MNRKDEAGQGPGKEAGQGAEQSQHSEAPSQGGAELPRRPAGHQEASRVIPSHSLLENTVHSSVVGGLARTAASVEAAAVTSKGRGCGGQVSRLRKERKEQKITNPTHC